MIEDSLLTAGHVSLDECTIINFRGREIPIKGKLGDVTLYENIMRDVVTGTMTITDTDNMINKIPIIGEEKVRISIKTPGFTEEIGRIKMMFRIVSVESVVDINTHKQIYVLRIISEDGYNNMNMKVAKAFSGTPNTSISQILSSILQTKRNIDIESASNYVKFVAPLWTPFTCIDWLASKCIHPSNKLANYRFFETNKGFSLKSFTTLVSENYKATYYFDDHSLRNGGTRDVHRELQTVREMRIGSMFDGIFRVETGMLQTTVYDFDIITKQYSKKKWEYTEDFPKTTHLSNYPMVSGDFTIPKIGKVLNNTSVHFLHNEMKVDETASIKANQDANLQMFDQFTIDLTVAGRTDLKVGDTINFVMGKQEAIDETDTLSNLKNKYYSGKYLIISIKHQFRESVHEMIMKVARESINAPFKEFES